ncbi:MAG: metallophosphoesterase, partial [Phycisphaerae bacterium]|nr:metallophosphoesterase [Phycisphaerae bacterium]
MNRKIFLPPLLLIVTLSACAPAPCRAMDGTVQPTDLLQSAQWCYSTDGGKTFSTTPPTVPAESVIRVIARTEFIVDDPSSYVVLELTHGVPRRHRASFTLNGKEVQGPLDGMFYRTIPAIDAKLLKKGKNVLTADISCPRHKAKEFKLPLKMSLAALKGIHLNIQTGPILGAIGKDYFTVTCRTNMPARISFCAVDAIRPPVRSGTGLIYRLKVPIARPVKRTDVLIKADVSDSGLTTDMRVPRYPEAGKFRFVAMGDSRTNVKDWAKVAAAVLETKPDLVVFTGDMVASGRDDWQWDNEFFAPAAEFFATIPFYAVIGNHEANAPVYNELFYTPSEDGRARNWSQKIGGVLLIGIDGTQGWAAESENIKWLAKTLIDGKDAKFIFLAGHYPAWTSARHGKLAENGLPAERQVREAQRVIWPLLVKHKATAMIAGHDHCYERSEPPGGVTHIITGGAGAPRYGKRATAEMQNPHSKVFASKLHYCLFTVTGDTCTMQAITPEGDVIDSRTWKAR